MPENGQDPALRILHRLFNAVRGGTDEFNFFVNVIAHLLNLNKISGRPEGKSRALGDVEKFRLFSPHLHADGIAR